MRVVVVGQERDIMGGKENDIMEVVISGERNIDIVGKGGNRNSNRKRGSKIVIGPGIVRVQGIVRGVKSSVEMHLKQI